MLNLLYKVSYKFLYSLVILLLSLCFSLSLGAQSITIKGKVSDVSGNLPGVNVQVKGTTVGAMTSSEGAYTIVAPSGDASLIFSFIGYTTQEVPINNRTTIDIELKSDVQQINELVVVGYGSTVKKDLTTAVSSVKSKDFLPGGVNSPLQLIDGKVAGVSISNPHAADPNRSTDVQIRGASSLKAGNGPLIIIDGMPGGDLRNVAQQDIESITVLKDGSAAAIYGSRAANGVILVQTKRAKAGKVRIDYDGIFEHDIISARPNVLSPEEFIAKGRAADKGFRTNWYDELINTDNFGHNHNLALSGGSETSKLRVSGNYRNKEAIDIASDRKEYGVRASFQQKTLEDLLEVSGNVSYRAVEEHPTNDNAFKQAVKLDPTVSKEEMKYFVGRYDEWNPIEYFRQRDVNLSHEYHTMDFNVKLNPFKNFYSSLQVARQGHNEKKREYFNSKHLESIDQKRIGRARLEEKKWINWSAQWINDYEVTIGKHNAKLMGGYTYEQFDYEGFWAENANFPSDAYKYNKLDAGSWNKVDGRLGMDSYKDREKNIAFLGRLNYNWSDIFLLTASARYEGNTKFGADNKWGLFPAASLAWRLSKLSLFENISTINDMKVRASWGVTGRSDFDKYQSLARYKGFGYYQNGAGEWVKVYGLDNNPNPNLSWEKQVSYNLGVDYTLFDYRLSGSIDFFVREGKDVIANYDAPVPPYLHQSIMTNVGTTNSKGFELQLDWNAIRSENFNYSTNLTVSYTKSKLVSFSNGIFNKGYMDGDGMPGPGNPGPAQRLSDGSEIGNFFGYRYAGVDDTGMMLVYKGGVEGAEKILATNAQDSDRTIIGNGAPKWELGWGHTFQYKAFDLSFFFTGRFDYQILNQFQMYFGLQAEPGVNLIEDAYTRNGHIKSGKVVTDYFLESGNYLRLNNLTLGWSPKVKSRFISNLRLYGTVRNVFTLTNYTGLDVTAVGTTGLWPGIGSTSVYPVVRTFTFGIQISY